MSTVGRYREQLLAAALLTSGGAATAVAAIWGPGADASAPVWVLVTAVVLGGAAALYAPLGARGVGLGATALPASAHFFGPAVAATAAAAAALVRGAARRWAGWPEPDRSEAVGVGRLYGRVGQAALATVAAAITWKLMAEPGSGLGGGSPWAALAAAAVYLGVNVGLDLMRSALIAETPTAGTVVPPYLLDLAGLGLGLLLAAVATPLGWVVALSLQAATAALAAEAARLTRLRSMAERRVEELREVTRAGHRIIFRNPDLLGIAEQIHLECWQVVRFEWFQFELLGEDGGQRSWFAGPERVVREGEPRPPEGPPTLPGIHRRAGWRVIRREFGTDDEVIARLRLWCDPRRLEDGVMELLDSLLPQMASSVQRALLDRVAKRDPLTDLADRRAFDSHLARVFQTARDEGTPMAVILCDVDSFKRINDLSGHAVGDQALMVVARLLESQSREEDFCCRMGGDEFAVVLEGADGVTALGTAERIRRAVARRKRSDLKTRIPLRLTAGVAGFPELPVRTPAELLQLADEAMYEAKRRGKNGCLLHLGRGRFRQPEGEVVGDQEASKVKPPTLFA